MDVLKLKEAGVSLGYEGDDIKTFVVEQQNIARQERLEEMEALKAKEEREALKAREEREALKGKTKGTPLWGTHRLKVLKRYHLRL